jgi:hypothetical protein
MRDGGFATGQCATLDGLDEGKKLRAVNQLDGFADGEVLGVTGEFAGRDDDGFIGLLGGHQAEHLADDRSADGKDFPLLALHERLATIPTERQIHTTVSATAQ